jgi:two-component system, NarL family, response regulator NreC
MQERIKIIIVDDQPLFRDSIRSFIKCTFPQIEIATFVNNKRNLFDTLDECMPFAILIDTEMEKEDIVEHISKNYPHVQILISDYHNQEALSEYLFKKQVHTYLTSKGVLTPPKPFTQALNGIADHLLEKVTRPLLESLVHGTKMSQSFPIKNLSFREQQVVARICLGWTSKEIGEIMNASHRTVETWRTIIMDKIGADTTADIIRYGVERKLHIKFGFAAKRRGLT